MNNTDHTKDKLPCVVITEDMLGNKPVYVKPKIDLIISVKGGAEHKDLTLFKGKNRSNGESGRPFVNMGKVYAYTPLGTMGFDTL